MGRNFGISGSRKINIDHKKTIERGGGGKLTITVRTTPPLAPSRAIASETALTTNCCRTKMTVSNNTQEIIIEE